jgi:thioredoxin-related protein
MFRYILPIILIILFIPGCGTEKGTSSEKDEQVTDSLKTTGESVTWHSFNEGLKLARQQDKQIIIDFYADWCKWCKVMEEKTFSDPEVEKRLSEHFICIKIYTDRPMKEPIRYMGREYTADQFSAAVGVRGLPTLLFMESDGDLITTIPGFIDKDIFLPLLSYMNKKCYLKKITLNEYMEGNTDCTK